MTKNTNKPAQTGTKNALTIWIVWDKTSSYTPIIADFKEKNTKYKNLNITVESFPDFEDYYLALGSAFSKGKWPDVFVFNNNEKVSAFEDQTIGINPSLVHPNEFRKKYKWVFADDLIARSGDSEYLKWIPVGYESLWIFFNRRYIRSSDLKTLGSLTSTIQKKKKDFSWKVAIALWNGSMVTNSSDIATQFVLLEDGSSNTIERIEPKIFQNGVVSYMNFGFSESDNAYNSLAKEMKAAGKNETELFSEGKILMLVGYPRLINAIDASGYRSSLLLAASFPHYVPNQWKRLINYNYFVINKNSVNRDAAQDFLVYLGTEEWAKSFFTAFPYYLPALLSLESDFIEKKIHKDYNIILKDFVDASYSLTSFDKGITSIYDQKLEAILDNETTPLMVYQKFIRSVVCKTNKVRKLTGFSSICE